MNPTGKKFISMFLTLSLLTINCVTFKSYDEKKGAKLIVIKIDGHQIRGELITIKPISHLFKSEPPSLLLLNTEGKDVSVDFADIKVIRIMRKSKAGKGFLIAGGYSTPLIMGTALIVRPEWDVSMETGFLRCVMYGLIIGTFGAIVGAAAGADKTIRIEGMTDSEIQEVLDKLRKKARIRDYK